MMYRSDGSATFIGFERIVGSLAGRAGSFVLQRTGVFENGMAKESYVLSSLALARESFKACAAKARRPSGTEWSIRSR